MVNNLNQPSLASMPLTWQSVLWRLVLTALLLLMLAGSGITIFSNATSRPGAQVLPTLTGSTEQESGFERQIFPGP
ncbi:MAG: hypothetical protein JW953_00430 [Anaerolineae bacterium]|nr:hypothetical protein [Anaerolineae bacterium]